MSTITVYHNPRARRAGRSTRSTHHRRQCLRRHDAIRTVNVTAQPDRFSITLIGPGGAGKTTVGALLAERLRIPFVDLDYRFADRAGDISEYITRFGYTAYARENVQTYRSLADDQLQACVVALSSGFMTYPLSIHPEYADLRQAVAQRPTTYVLIPSLEREACVAETVRRQLTRPFARSAAREEAVIRQRFPIYVGLSARKIETMRLPTAVVDAILTSVRTLV
jgi:shikimate kinase